MSSITTEKIELAIGLGFVIGTSFLVINALLGKWAKDTGGRIAKIFVEFERKSFHMIGGCLLASGYHWGMKKGYLTSAYMADKPKMARGQDWPLDAGAVYLAFCFSAWLVEFARLQIPFVRDLYLKTFKGLVREKEFNAASGVAYFIPGILVAMLAGPSNTAILGILFLSIGDAASSIGTAGGYIPVGSSKRKVEGSIACFIICGLLAHFAGLSVESSLVTSCLVTFAEVLAEVIGVDDNLIIPVVGVLGVRIAENPQYAILGGAMGAALGIGVLLGAVVSLTTPSDHSKPAPAKKTK
jgi:dolichol kinase